jgi:membrane protein DedA with SNARE-associated domain
VFGSAIGWLSHHAAIVILLNLSLGVFGVPAVAETLLLTGGAMMARDGTLPWSMVVAAAAGSAIGMTICFQAGRLGNRLLIWPVGRTRRSPRLIRIQEWSRRFGPWSIVLMFFTPGLRHVSAAAAGATRLEFKRFIIFAVGGACVWASLLLAGGYVVGQRRVAGGTTSAPPRDVTAKVHARAILERVHAVFLPHVIHEVRRLRGDTPRQEFVVAVSRGEGVNIATHDRAARPTGYSSSSRS